MSFEVLSKNQYILKQSPYCYLASKINLIFMILCFSLIAEFGTALCVFAIGSLILYRYAFSLNKMDSPYSAFLLSLFVRFMKFIGEAKW